MLPKILGNDSLLREIMITGRKVSADEARAVGESVILHTGPPPKCLLGRRHSSGGACADVRYTGGCVAADVRYTDGCRCTHRPGEHPILTNGD